MRPGLRLGHLVARNGLAPPCPRSACLPQIFTTQSFHRDGWFVGGDVENSLNIFGVAAPGWFMKTEYRSTY
jgi:hypothetical protein